MGNRLLFLLLVLGLWHSRCPGQQADSAAATSGDGLIVLPGIFYTPETRLGVAGLGMYYFRPDGAAADARPSTLTLTAVYTANKQISASLRPDLYLSHALYHLTGELTVARYPDRYFGIGNDSRQDDGETYTPEFYLFAAGLQRLIAGSLSAGIQFGMEHAAIVNTEPGGFLHAGLAPGAEGGTASGFGIITSWDDRDNAFSSRAGAYVQFQMMAFRRALGSDYSFHTVSVDLRKYYPVSPLYTVAVQAMATSVRGDAPFRALSRIGGENLLRGYLAGRFRDRDGLVLQVEHRLMPVWWRIGVIGFAGMGQVAAGLDRFALQQLKYSAGVGFRFQLDPVERIHIKLDIGSTAEGMELYFGVGEAF